MRRNGSGGVTTIREEVSTQEFHVSWYEVWSGKPFDSTRRDAVPLSYERGRQVAVMAKHLGLTPETLENDPSRVMAVFADAIVTRYIL